MRALGRWEAGSDEDGVEASAGGVLEDAYRKSRASRSCLGTSSYLCRDEEEAAFYSSFSFFFFIFFFFFFFFFCLFLFGTDDAVGPCESWPAGAPRSSSPPSVHIPPSGGGEEEVRRRSEKKQGEGSLGGF